MLENVGLTSHEPVEFNGQKISPVAFLRSVLPDPASLAERYTGKICIGCDITGVKDGETKRYFRPQYPRPRGDLRGHAQPGHQLLHRRTRRNRRGHGRHRPSGAATAFTTWRSATPIRSWS